MQLRIIESHEDSNTRIGEIYAYLAEDPERELWLIHDVCSSNVRLSPAQTTTTGSVSSC